MLSLKFRCISYKEVLPNGVCINELKNYNIFQSPFRAKFINEGKQLEKIFLSYVKDKTREQVLLYLNRAIRAFFNRYIIFCLVVPFISCFKVYLLDFVNEYKHLCNGNFVIYKYFCEINLIISIRDNL